MEVEHVVAVVVGLYLKQAFVVGSVISVPPISQVGIGEVRKHVACPPTSYDLPRAARPPFYSEFLVSLGVNIDGRCVLDPIARVAMRECSGVSRNAVVRATPRRAVDFAELAGHSCSCQMIDKGDDGFGRQGPRKEFRRDGLIAAFGVERAWRLQTFAGPIGPVTKGLLVGHLLDES